MSIENLASRVEQTSEDSDSLDNNVEQPSFDSRVEPLSSNNGVDNLSAEGSRSKYQNDIFDSRVEPQEVGPAGIEDNPSVDFDDRVPVRDNPNSSDVIVPERLDEPREVRLDDDPYVPNEIVHNDDDLIVGAGETSSSESSVEFGEIVGQVNNNNTKSKIDAPSVKEKNDSEVDNAETKNGLSEAEREQIKAETGWSDSVIDYIDNMDQYEIYKKANLKEVLINDRPCLVKADFDPDYVSPKTIDDEHPNGVSNRELMAEGKSPYDYKTGEKLELHHMGQDYDSPFAELCENSEHGDGNHKILHDDSKPSWRRDPDLKQKYNNEDKPDHWKNRSAMV